MDQVKLSCKYTWEYSAAESKDVIENKGEELAYLKADDGQCIEDEDDDEAYVFKVMTLRAEKDIVKEIHGGFFSPFCPWFCPWR